MADEKGKPSAAPEPTMLEVMKVFADSLKPKGPLEDAGLPQEQIDRITKPPEPKSYRIVPCKSPDTGSTFDALVVMIYDGDFDDDNASKKYPHGKIAQLLNYRHPEGAFTYRSQGGLVPDGMPILRDPTVGKVAHDTSHHQLDADYKKWRWEDFWRADIRRICGAPFSAHLCIDPEKGMKTPWVLSKIARAA
jgi:hypothetical protein